MSMTVISRASFRVYKDTSSSAPQSKTETRAGTTGRHIVVSTAADKENLHPVTGLPPRMLTCLSKKRKTDVLTTKFVVAKEEPSSPKKRKLSASSSKIVPNSRAPQHRKPTTKRANGFRAIRLRRKADLPKVEEELEVVPEYISGGPGRLSPEAVDARCYELTVLPLADISEAYETSSDDDSVKSREPITQRVEVETTAPSPSSTPRTRLTWPPTAGTDKVALATPERKRIYSAFTFTPSYTTAQQHHGASASKYPFSDIFLDTPASQP